MLDVVVKGSRFLERGLGKILKTHQWEGLEWVP